MAGERTLPGLGLTGFWNAGSNDWGDQNDQNLLKLSALTMPVVLSMTTALPGSPSDGDIYLVPAGAGSNANEIAVRDDGAWSYFAPEEGWRVFVVDAGAFVVFDGAGWALDSSLPPLAGNAGKVLAVNGTEDGLDWVDQTGGGGGDLPSLTGNAGKVLAVNATEDGLEWVDQEGGGGGGGVTVTHTIYNAPTGVTTYDFAVSGDEIDLDVQRGAGSFYTSDVSVQVSTDGGATFGPASGNLRFLWGSGSSGNHASTETSLVLVAGAAGAYQEGYLYMRHVKQNTPAYFEYGRRVATNNAMWAKGKIIKSAPITHLRVNKNTADPMVINVTEKSYS